MKRMKIVIEIHDIPTNDHERWILKYGTPLPKHHGRLIDADALTISHGVLVPRLPGDAKVFYGCPMDAVFADEIKNAETIIPATKEGEEK